MISLHAVILTGIAKKQAETVNKASKQLQTININVETLTHVVASYLECFNALIYQYISHITNLQLLMKSEN